MVYFSAPERIQRDSLLNYQLKHLIGTCCYVPILIFYICAAFWELNYDVEEDSPAYETIYFMKNYRYYYFSVWNLVLQSVFIIVCLIDLLANAWEINFSLQNRIYKFRCYLFAGAVFPFTILITMTFWGLYHIDRKLLFPDEVFQALPNWLNHTLHTAILLPILIEFLLPRTYLDVDWLLCIIVMTWIYSLQAILCFLFYLIHGKWLYPLFTQFDLRSAKSLGIMGFLVAACFTILGAHIHNKKEPIYRHRRRYRETMD